LAGVNLQGVRYVRTLVLGRLTQEPVPSVI
jgi:hypothetical protein